MNDATDKLAGIAVVGMAGRFPKARNLDEFWRNLCAGTEAISFFSEDELAKTDTAVQSSKPNYVKARAVLEDADYFDAAFFGMNPREAELTDPQHRLFLEAAWEALEDANCDPDKCGEGVGVFAGMSTNTYLANNLAVTPQLLIGINGEFQAMVGNERDYLTTRVSYKLNLRGPSLNIQTACSTSLVAVSMACQHLLTYQCNLALAGAVSVSFPQKRGYLYQEGGITSPDGHCRPFDAQSAGTVAGDGVGVVALKRLADALQDGDAIYAVIKGFATNNDGALKIGYTAPSVQGQADVIALAQAMAGFSPETISYVEAHGTGTPLGDPIEIEGLTRAFRLGTGAKHFCAIGSVKSNIGHLDTAAGIAGLIKTALALRHKTLPPTVHFNSPNPKINFADSPFRVNQALTPWTNGDLPRRAGVSSFGIGGTNAHIVLEEAPAREASGPSRPVQILLLSTRTKSALRATASNLAGHLASHPETNLADVAYTLQTGRRAFEHREIFACRNTADAAAQLESLDPKRVFAGSPRGDNPPVVFMFPGQGAQHAGMGRQLYESEAVFQHTVDQCCKLLEPQLGMDLRTALYPQIGQDQPEAPQIAELSQTAITQPAMFVIEYALAKLWMSWGIQPAAMIGHSLGEYVAACLAGVFSLDDALTLIAARGRLMQALPPGMMLAVRLPEQELKPLLTELLSIAAVNAATSCVVSGPAAAVESFRLQLEGRKAGCVTLRTSHAFHSAMMEPVRAPFAELVRKIKPQPPTIPFISNVTGTWITDAQAADPAYWETHLRRTVRFADGLAELFKADRVFLEVGPGRILSNLAGQHAARQTATPVIDSLGSAKDESSELEAMLTALGRLWISGLSPAWEKFHAGEKRQRVWLPTYPFERQRFWVEPPHAKSTPADVFGAGASHTNGNGLTKHFAVGTIQQNPASANRISEHTPVPSAESQIRFRLRALVGSLSGLDPATLDSGATFTQQGFDSLFLTQATVAIERDFGLRVAFRQLLEEFPTIDSLADHMEENLSVGTKPPETPSGDARPRSDQTKPGRITTATLTGSQREIWFASQISEAASCVYNECRLLHLRGPLQTNVLREALQTLVLRHEALRATFLPGGETQQFHPAFTIDVPLADWSALDASECESRLDAAQAEEARQPFDLVRGPLIRARLIQLASEHHVFIVTVHHLVCDGYSFGILVRELGAIYSAGCLDKQTGWPPPLQFSEYAKYQMERTHTPPYALDEEYWLNQFGNGTPALDLPTDRPRGSVWQFDGAREGLALPEKLGQDLKRLSAEHGCTLFTTLFAAYTLLLGRLSRQKEVVVGVPLADRAIPQGETLVGHCVNFLPLRGSIESNRPFSAHLAAMQRVFLAADEHGRYTLGSLLQKRAGSRDPNRMSLISATFNLDRVAVEPAFFELETKLADNAHSAASFDISMDVIESGAGLQLNCRYNAALFDVRTIRRWLAHFQTLLEEIVADPQRRSGDLPLLTESERNEILVQWNQTSTEYPRAARVHDIFEEQAAKASVGVAVEFEGTRLTYDELNERANRLAHYLQRLGVGPETIVAVCLDRSLEMIVALLGILKAGGAYLALDPSHPRDRLALLLKEARAAVVVTQENHRSLLPETAGEVVSNLASQITNPMIVCLDSGKQEIEREPRTNPTSPATAESLAYIGFTSGSSGKPKGICIPHRAIVRLVKNTNYASLERTETFLQLAPLAFDASTFEIWGALLNGATLVVFPPHAPSLSELGEFIKKRGITTLWLTSGLFHQMIEAQTASLRGVRQLLAGGDVLSVPHVRQALAELPDCRLINGYGPTENTTFTCCHLITKTNVKSPSIPIGRPIANTQVYLLDEARQPVPIGVAGELYAGGDGLAQGYLNQPELTAEKFVSNPFSNDPRARLYKTGDLARWLPDGSIQFLGRLDTQVKIRGNRVELGEIESPLGGHPSVRECVVTARSDRAGDNRLIAYFVSAHSAPPSPEDLRGHLRRALPDYMVPAAFVRLDSLPLTASGKVDRKALPEPNESEIESCRPFIPAGDDVERQLVGIWQDVLGKSRVGMTDDFFELGGHSLLALRLIARVETAFGKELPVASVFQARTVALMAALLREKSPPPRSTSIVEIQPRGSRPPLMLVHGAGGGMFWGYSALAQHLGPDQPVFGFKSRDADECQFASLTEMARYFVADLRAFQPTGPYRLGGYCFGGNVAYEMARELRAKGEGVALLVLINCMPPNSSYDRVRFSPGLCVRFLKNLIYWGNYVLHLKHGRRREFLGWKLRTLKNKLLHMLRISGSAPLDVDIEDFVDLTSQPEGRRGLWEAHVHALFKHQHKSYPGRLTLLRTRGHSLLCSFDEAFGWRELADGGVSIRIVSGAHETIMDEPHVQSLAEELRKCLDESNAAAGVQPSQAAVASAHVHDPEIASQLSTQGSAAPEARSIPPDSCGLPGRFKPASGDARPPEIGNHSKCIHELFEEQAARTPGAVALVFKDERLTYAELNRRADQIASHLTTLGIGPDIPVGICLERSFDMVAGVLAILKAGGAYVPLDPVYPGERLKIMLENTRVPVLLTQTSLRNRLQFGIPNLKLLCLDGAEFQSQAAVSSPESGLENPIRETITILPASLAYIIHTSGSTGAPKGVAIEHRNTVSFISWAQQVFTREELAGVLFSTSLCFDLSVFELFVTLSTGGKVIIARNALELAELPARNEVTLINTVPSAAAELLRLNAVPPGVQVINLAGEPLKTSLVDRLYALGTVRKVYDLYGPSETTTYSTCALRQAGAPATIGKPIANTQIHLLDKHRQTVPAGEVGEIFIGGAGVVRGYLHRPDLTAERFVPDPFNPEASARLYKTGDLARWQPDGNLEFLGRIDHQIKIRGYRVELGEIETVLAKHPAVSECVVIAREDTPGEKRLVAYVVPASGHASGTADFKSFLQAKLPDYMVPAAFVSLAKLPLTPNGKLDRKLLPPPDQSRPERAEDLIAPGTAAEKKIAEIWREVLGANQIGIKDDFFAWGGDSLMAVRVVSRLRQAFEVEVPVAALFEAPTIALLAEGLATGRWNKGISAERPITPARREGKLPLSFSQQRLWFIDQLAPGNPAYNLPVAVRLQGRLDADALEECLNDIVRRHEILRTTFPVEGGEPEQKLWPNLAVKVRLVDLSSYPASERESEARRELVAEAQRPFDLARGPLLRATLLRLDEREHVLLVVMHHIVSDGWSLDVFLRELAGLLAAKTTGGNASLRELTIQYADYAVWQRQSWNDETLRPHLDYWKQALAGAPASLSLPFDKEGATATTPAAAYCSVSLPQEAAAAMQNLNRQAGSTSFMTLLAALMVTLNRWTRQADIVAGTVSAGRTRRETEGLIGCFMNFLPIRSVLGETDTGLEILARVKQAVLNAHAHLECPFEKIVEAVNPKRGSAPSPIYNVGFLLENFPKAVLTTQQLKGTLLPVETNAALLDLRFVADEGETGITLTCEYRADLFAARTIEDLLASFRGILQTLLSKPGARLDEFTLTKELAAQSQCRCAPANRIAVAATFTAEPLAEPLEFWLRELELPAQIQFAPYNQVFQQLLDPGSLLSRNPRGLNVVLVRFEDWASAAGISDEAPSQTPPNIEQTLNDLISALRSAAARSAAPFLLCLCPSQQASSGEPRPADCFGHLYGRLAAELASASNVHLVLPDQLAALYPVDDPYDSRSNELGRVPYTPAFFTALATMIARKFNSQKRPGPKAIVLDCDQTLWAGVCGEDGPEGVELRAPYRALQEFMRAQADAGRLLCICSKNNPEDVQAVFERRPEMPLKARQFAATRTNWQSKSLNLKSLAEELNLGLDSFVLVDDNPIECAEVQANCPGAVALQLPESPELIPHFLKHCWLFDHYTLTAEDKQRTEFYRQERQRAQAQTNSLSMAEFLAKLDLTVRIEELSPQDRPRAAQLTQRTNQFNCAPRRLTEAELQGTLEHRKALAVFASDRFGDYGLVGLVICVLERDTLKAETFLLSCRALGRGVEHRMLAHLGDIAKTKGAALVDVHFVASTRNQPALDFLDSVGGPFRQALNGGYVFRFPAAVAAEVSFNPGNSATALPSLAQPARKPAPPGDSGPAFSRWRWLALEANEVSRIQALIETKAGVRKIGHSNIAVPRTAEERELCLIWQELLRIERVGIQDNFFDLGGHSLLAVRLFAQIEKRLGVRLPIITVFQSPTIEQLARAVGQQGSPSPGSGLLPIQSKGARPPLFLVHGAGGDVLWGYANLAHHSDPDQPIFGIQAGGEEQFSTLEDMAADYVEKVRAFQPAGPYFLGGYCFGGNVAQEMARQLEARGEHVALLALLDCAPSNCGYETSAWWRPAWMWKFSRNLLYWLKDFAHLEPAQRRSLVARKLRILPRKLWGRLSGRARDDFDLEEFIDLTDVSERETRLWNNHLGLLVRHVSKPCVSPMTLFRTCSHPLVCSFENDFGWQKLGAKITVKNIPGSHEGIFIEPHVRDLAAELEKSLRAGLPGSASSPS